MQRRRVLSIVPEYPSAPDDRVVANVKLTRELLAEAEEFDPDVVSFPEVHLQYGEDGTLDPADGAVAVNGPELADIRSATDALGAYVLLPTYERRGDAIHNSAVLLDPDGGVHGICRKLAPTVGEMDAGVVPGSEVAVWETAVGRIGALVCWDARYPEVGVKLGEQAADIVLFPTQGRTDNRLQTWARYYGFHVVSTHKHTTETFTPTGGVLGGTTVTLQKVPSVETASGGGRFSLVEVNTDCAVYSAIVHADRWNDIQREYGDALAFHGTRNDGAMYVESIDESVSITDIEAEFDLERMPAYEARTRQRVHQENPDSPLIRRVERSTATQNE